MRKTRLNQPGQVSPQRFGQTKYLHCLEPRGHYKTLSLRWKRSFDLYALAKGTVEDRQKPVALLLHTARIRSSGSLVPDYKDVVELLDSSFVPKVNVPCERHVFFQLKQQSLPSSV